MERSSWDPCHLKESYESEMESEEMTAEKQRSEREGKTRGCYGVGFGNGKGGHHNPKTQTATGRGKDKETSSPLKTLILQPIRPIADFHPPGSKIINWWLF